MKKFILNPHLMLMAFITLIVVSSASVTSAQADKKVNQSIIIKNGDTTINGKKLSEADQEERIRLRQVFRDMEGCLKRKAETIDKRVIIKPKGWQNHEIIINGKGNVPHILYWEDDNMKELDLDINHKMPGGLNVFKFNGDSMSFDFNIDTIIKDFRIYKDGLDSNLRKRIITMHRNMTPRAPRMPMRPSSPMFFEFERSELADKRDKNNSTSFNYNSTDKTEFPAG